MNKKFIISGLVSLGLITSSFAADITYYGLIDGSSKINSINFSDVNSMGNTYWAKPAIFQIASMGIMSGLSSNSFAPTSPVTNEQAVTVILNATGKADEVDNIKMLVNNWSDKYIKYAMNEGLITEKIVYKRADIKGDIDTFKDKGVFIRDIPITREEVATLIYRAFNLPTTSNDENKKPVEFLDKVLIDESRASHVDAISLAGIMAGDESGMFNPKSSLTRAEFAQILKNCEDYLVNDLRLTKISGFIDSVSGSGFEFSDDKGNSIFVNCVSRDIPVIRNNTLSGVSVLRNADEIELLIDSSKQVIFIRVIDDGIYDNNSQNSSSKAVSKQGIVTGNSPYFYEISIKDKNGNIETYKYGAWTDIYKDGKETRAGNILQGDTVYLEFDEIGDLVVIRGVTNAVISYGTIIDIDDYDITFKMDADKTSKEYNLKRIPVYKNGIEVEIDELKIGEYVKLYSSLSEIIKAEVVLDERTVENLYKGYISEINLIQDRIILRNPKVFSDGKWESAESSFVTISLDNDMKVMYDGDEIGKEDLGQKQVGKFAYIATREDTLVLERVKIINIEFEDDTESISGEIRSYKDSSGLLKIYDDSRKLYTDDSTIYIIDGKIVPEANLEQGDNIFVTVSYIDGEYKVKMLTDIEKPEEREVEVYYGVIEDIDSGEEVSIELIGKLEDEEWDETNKSTSFTINDDTRIFNETEPLTFKEFNKDYEGKKVCVVAYKDEAVSMAITDLGELPYITVGSVKSVSDSKFTVYDVEYFDHEEGDWLEGVDKETINIDVTTLIVKNGNFARNSEIKEGQEAVIIRTESASPASVILLTE